MHIPPSHSHTRRWSSLGFYSCLRHKLVSSYCSGVYNVWTSACHGTVYADRGQRFCVESAGMCGKINTKFWPMFTASVFAEIASVLNVTGWRIGMKLRARLVLVLVWKKIPCLICHVYLDHKFSSFLFHSELWEFFLLTIMAKRRTYVRTHTHTHNDVGSLSLECRIVDTKAKGLILTCWSNDFSSQNLS